MSGIRPPSREKLLAILRSLPRPDITNMFGRDSTHKERMGGGFVTIARAWLEDVYPDEIFLVSIQGVPETQRAVLATLEEILGPGQRDDLSAREPKMAADLAAIDAQLRKAGHFVPQMTWYYWPADRLKGEGGDQ